MTLPDAVTFDCWSTLLYEAAPDVPRTRRRQILIAAARECALPVDEESAAAALDAAWQRHAALWHEGVVSGAAEIAAWALTALAAPVGRSLADVSAALPALAARLAEATLDSEVLALEGARDTLERLAAAGVRLALICDTGMSPGRVVRRLLDRQGLLEPLEVTVFSDEAGAPKPDPRVFHLALEPLGVAPAGALHVGDLRRTDVAGARAVGMRTVRIRHHHDDQASFPEADHVADSHRHLQTLLGLAP